jgi:hypothetical protein
MLLPAVAPFAAGAGASAPVDPAGEAAVTLGDDEIPEIVAVTVDDRAAITDLIEAGADVTEYVKPIADGVEVHVVATEAEQAHLRELGFDLGETVVDAAQVEAVIDERQAAVQRDRQIERAAATDTLTVLRSEWFESIGGQTYLNVEVKSSAGADSTTVLTASWGDSPPVTMDRFVDAGQYLYHRFNEPIPVNAIPDEVTITSSAGGSVTAPVEKWLGEPRKAPGLHYATGFVDHYMDPTEAYARIESLAAEFPSLAEVVDLPYKTNGYRRAAQAMIGTANDNRFYVTSKAWGHEGGNDLALQTRDPGSANSALSVTVAGDTIDVSLATDGSGALTSTAAQVVAAINASPEASALVSASTYRGNAGDGVALVGSQQLSDSLDAPASVSREPFQVRALRIGKHRDGSKTGVLAYAQEHAREWVTPLVTIETAERLLRNYRTDAAPRQLVDNLDIFIIPSVNPDGAHYSFYDNPGQRRNMTDYCGPENSDPNRINSWGVDVNRNFSVGSRLDGYFGASGSCTSDVYSGPAELSEPEARNEVWLTEQYPNIKFAMNIHSYGGYFMWPPGAYVEDGRVPLPRPTVGQEDYFWASSSNILSAVQGWRGTGIWPGRTGPVIDVLYSAAGNSADEAWYNRGIFGWDFEVGADLWDPQGQDWDPVGFQPPFAEGYEEAMEFSNGLIGLFEVAQAYGNDHRPPTSQARLTPDGVVFEASEPVTVHYTLDGSRPTYASPMVESAGLREGAAPVPLPAGSTTVHWFSVDAAGNVEGEYDPNGHGTNYRSATFTVD